MARPRKKRKYTKRAAYWGADVAKGRGATVAKRGRPPKAKRNGNGTHLLAVKGEPAEKWMCYVKNRAEYYGPFDDVASMASWATAQYGTGWSLCKLEPVPAPN